MITFRDLVETPEADAEALRAGARTIVLCARMRTIPRLACTGGQTWVDAASDLLGDLAVVLHHGRGGDSGPLADRVLRELRALCSEFGHAETWHATRAVSIEDDGRLSAAHARLARFSRMQIRQRSAIATLALDIVAKDLVDSELDPVQAP
jgi:hypothetical protein